MPIRIYDIAKKLNTESKEVLAKARELGIGTARVPSSQLSDEAAQQLENALREELSKVPRSSLRNVVLGGFKAFADPQTIPIRPLTLVFGANSSGKSSFLHGLLLAHHAVQTGELDIFKTLLGGDAVDLGGFRQYVHRRNTDTFVEFALELAVQSLPVGLRAGLPSQAKVLRAEMRWGAPAFDSDEHGQPIPRTAQVRACDFFLDDKPALRLFRQADGRFRIKELGQGAFAAGVAALIQSGTTVSRANAEDLEAAGRALAGFAAHLQFEGTGCLPGSLVVESVGAADADVALQPVSRGERSKDLAAAFRLFAPRLVSEMLSRLGAAVTAELRKLAYLGPLRSFPPRHLPFGEIRDTNWEAGGGKAWDVLRRNSAVRARVNQWLSDPKRLSTPFELALRRHVASADLEALLTDQFENVQVSPPARDPETFRSILTSTRNFTVPDVLRTKLETGEISRSDYDKALREMMKSGELEVTEENAESRILDFDPEKAASSTLERIHKELETIDDMVLTDKRTNTLVTHRDVGIGISQVLPVLVHAYADKGRIVAIEQPEIHLHPALQAELGDVFIESALGEQRNTFLLETHSEHLILRILRRVRETTENKLEAGKTPVRPDDVTVVFVEPTPKGSVVRCLPVTPDGDFEGPWPGGFFAERLSELP